MILRKRLLVFSKQLKIRLQPVYIRIQNVFKKIIISISIMLLASTILTFVIVFLSTLALGLFVMLTITNVNENNGINIFLPLIISGVLGGLAATVRIRVMRKFSKIKV